MGRREVNEPERAGMLGVGLLLGAALGGLLGAAAGLLLAPRAGGETRTRLAGGVHHLQHRVTELLHEVRANGHH